MMAGDLADRVAAVRLFNRFYTRRIGVLEEGLLESPFSLTEARVLYELAQGESATAARLAHQLGLDPGYLSRILAGFEKRGLLARMPCERDGRQSLLVLTEPGRAAFAALDARSAEETGTLLGALSAEQQARLVAAMDGIAGLLAAPDRSAAAYALRPHRAGDMGWIVHRHGLLYAQEYGWNEEFEALVAEIAAKFIRHYDPRRERCWIAERDGERLGSVMLVAQSPRLAKLRLLLVEPQARGLGIGSRLVEECSRFAGERGYRKITLWTNSVLVAARRIYERAGFSLVEAQPHRSFGHDLVGENWELPL
ncbi:MAG TPA: bifunctional helix-turn-helix transcriptional regulator/GNAT family N-acetyltransferase [Stellaceae bacterium]|nr:bifunctional helix-turn-helix transcriptional regulator/GNAT family N-acetyltransferase [Stellaceae bacterium]